MKNVLKLCLILALCLSVLLVAGCKSEEKKTDEPTKNPETTGTTEDGGETKGNENQNPEGDPFDTDVGAEDDPVEGPDPTEPPVGIDDNQGGEEDDFDFEIDFGEDLAG